MLSSFLLSRNEKVRIYKTTNLSVISYGCGTWSLRLWKEHKLRVLKNRVLRRIFRPRRDDETGGWKGLYNEGLHNLYSSASIISKTSEGG
jgi:hypothetical protein